MSGRDDIEAEAGEVKVQVAGLRVIAVDDDLAGTGRYQRTFDGHARVVVGRHNNRATCLQAARITMGFQVSDRYGLRGACDLESIFRGHCGLRAVAIGSNAVVPTHQRCQAK